MDTVGNSLLYISQRTYIRCEYLLESPYREDKITTFDNYTYHYMFYKITRKRTSESFLFIF